LQNRYFARLLPYRKKQNPQIGWLCCGFIFALAFNTNGLNIFIDNNTGYRISARVDSSKALGCHSHEV